MVVLYDGRAIVDGLASRPPIPRAESHGPFLKRREFFDILGGGIAALAVSGLGGCGPDPQGTAASNNRNAGGPLPLTGGPTIDQIAMLVYPGFTLLDLAGPHTCFAGLTLLGWTVHLVWKTLDPVTSDFGASIVPTTTFEQCPMDLDILFVPGSTSGTSDMVRDPEVIEFLRSRGERAKLVTSVCTGSIILGAAGLLRGYKATSHWLLRDMLPTLEAESVHERVVKDGNRITGAGVSAGIDFGLRIVDKLAGRDVAEMTQLMLEYAPEPPFNAGSPETASAFQVATLQAAFAPLLLDGQAALEEARANL